MRTTRFRHWTDFVPLFPLLSNKSTLAIFAVLWLASHAVSDGLKISATHKHFATIEVIKLAISIVLYTWQGQDASQYRRARDIALEDSQDLEDHSSDGDEETMSPTFVSNLLSSPQSRISLLFIAAMFALRSHVALDVRYYSDPLSLDLALPITTLCSLFLLKVCFSRSFTAVQYHAAILLLYGFYMIQSSVAISQLSEMLMLRLLVFAMLSSLTLVLSDVMYKTHSSTSFHILNINLFACTFTLHLIVIITQAFTATSPENTLDASNGFSAFALPLLQACKEIAALAVIDRFDAAAENVAASWSSSLLLLGFAAYSLLPLFSVWAGCALVLVASGYYLWSQKPERSEIPSKLDPHTISWTAGIIVSWSFSILIGLAALRNPYLALPPRHLSVASVFSASKAQPDCFRKPLPLMLNLQRNYNAFDNVLVIVFFSHPRYNVNLDYYKEVYSDFFPNMVFIGPASREDKGFSHSYDVILDSYQQDEDLNDPDFYKMAGRTGHHQLYTALKEYGCGYDGYLWTPFDTLLNIPRLQQFNQDQFWYHSPWGQYVPNPAFESVEANQNKSRHAPPVKISPDPAINLTETWRGWGNDWWWGDKHVGLAVCMKAFNKVPLRMRERLALLTDGKTRLLGGSADTLYIPNRLRKDLMEVLALFLETDCFMEIAIPTAVHLVLPPDDHILFVDHWWIWQPPFNATYVRQQWAQGFEVDTFHTFHWGDKGADGVWRGNREHIADVRQLLRESAKRQRISFPSRYSD